MNGFLNTLGVTTLLTVVVLSGCLQQGPEDLEGPAFNENSQSGGNTESSGNTNEPIAPAENPRPDEKTGSVTGEVADSDFNPLTGASARLYNSTGTITETVTDSDGKYTINDISPGRYNIEFNAPCCREGIQRIDVIAGKTANLSIVLEIWDKSTEPFVTKDQWTGFISCFIPPLYSCSPDPNHDTNHGFEVKTGIRTLMIYMEWAEGINAEECLRLSLTTSSNDEFQNAWLYSPGECETSPLEFRLDAGEMAHLRYDFENITSSMLLNFIVRTSGTNIVFQQPFTVYWEEHYWDHAPEGASALPDS